MILPVIFSSDVPIYLQILIIHSGNIFLWSIDKDSDNSNNIIKIGDLNVDFLNILRSHSVNDNITAVFLENTIIEQSRITQNMSALIDPI